MTGYPMKRRRTIAATAAQHKSGTRDERRAEASTLKIENLDAYIATALEHSSLMCLLDAIGEACGRKLASKNWVRARELNRRWLRRQQSVWDATYALKTRGLDTERWHSKVENLDAYIARVVKQRSLVSVLDAIANACLVKAGRRLTRNCSASGLAARTSCGVRRTRSCVSTWGTGGLSTPICFTWKRLTAQEASTGLGAASIRPRKPRPHSTRLSPAKIRPTVRCC
jgi:hypothetical protein